MVPESGAQRRVDLYEAVEFPYRWQRKRTLIDHIRAYDSTLLWHDHTWWMFSTVSDGHGVTASDELYIHYTHDLLTGSWTPHAANPVVSDATCARPAGSFFNFEGRWFRPAQDSSGSYGYGLVILEVETLTKTEYRERLCRRFIPSNIGAQVRGIHTYNACHGLTIVDFLV